MLWSHPTWVCGLKLRSFAYKNENFESHPTWVCGLKRVSKFLRNWHLVTPYVGVWIETLFQ